MIEAIGTAVTILAIHGWILWGRKAKP